MNTHDVVIVGGGAAGLSAALVLARARRSVLVVDSGAPRNAPAAHMQGFLSRDGMPPADLLAAGRAEIEQYGGRIETGLAVSASRASQSFTVRLEGGEVVAARRLLVTTGLTDELPDIDGARERWGRDLLHCPYCHGYEVRDRPIAVIGGTPDAVQHALLIRQWSDDVVYFAHTDVITDAERRSLTACAVGIVEGVVTRLVVTGDRLTGIEVDGGVVIDREAAFVRPRMRANGDLLGQLGCALDDRGWAVAGPSGETSVPGVWVAGNASNPRAQVITAAGEGSAAAIAINADLVAEDVSAAVREHTTPALPVRRPARGGPPSTHVLALMIWLCVFPTLTVLNLGLGGWLATLAPVLRTLVLTTIAVPIVIYGLMPQLHRLRARALARGMGG
jgi:thioredoxin reductase